MTEKKYTLDDIREQVRVHVAGNLLLATALFVFILGIPFSNGNIFLFGLTSLMALIISFFGLKILNNKEHFLWEEFTEEKGEHQ